MNANNPLFNKLNRRNFLKISAVGSGSLLLGISLAGCGAENSALTADDDSFIPNAFLRIDKDNQITFYCPRDEMGQGVTTGLTTIIAEELDVEPQVIKVELAGVHEDYGNPELGMQTTGGSTSVKAHYEPLRHAGAAARFVILEAAAKQLKVDKSSLTTHAGEIFLGDKKYAYGEFVEQAAQQRVPETVSLKDPEDFKYIGTEFARLDALEKSTGTAVYAIDIELPDLHYAVINRSPVVGGTVLSYDATQALSMPGILRVIDLECGVAVVAEQFWQAKQAAESLQIDWSSPEFAKVTSKQIKDDYQTALANEEGDEESSQGDVEKGFAGSTQVIEQQYWAPYLAHAPLEPMNAVVHLHDGRAEVWSGTQGPAAAQGLVARITGLDKAAVTIHSTLMGGGFGRRTILTHIVEATQLAMATEKPIKLIWTREDDIQNGFYRPASLMKIKAGIDKDGKISAWSAKRVGGNIMPDLLENILPGILPKLIPNGMTDWMASVADSIFDGWAVDPASVEGLYEDYDAPNKVVTHVTVNHGLPLLYWRSVGHSYTAFAKEVMIDELAELARQSVIEFRLQNTQNNPRLNKVIRLAGEKARRMKLADGHQLGFAAHASFNSYVAQVADVSIENGKIRVHKVVCALDCGQVINPDIVRGQMEGAIMFGLTAALYGEINLQNGVVQQSNFHDYPLLRMNESPEVETIIVNSKAAPTGVGEPGLPPIAPAVANAVYAITGKRLRSLPLRLV